MQPTPNKPDLPGAPFLPVKPNRRWKVRQKIHRPAYVSVDPCEDGTIFGLNAIFDIGTGGLAFQNPEVLNPGADVNLNLELSGVEHSIHATGRVVWSDPSGRTGIELKRESLSDADLLDEYLFLNAITACTHYEALRTGSEDSGSTDETLADQVSMENSTPAGDMESANDPAVLAWLAEIRREIDGAEPGSQPSRQIIAEGILNFLHASGVAIAISSEQGMVCQASAGVAPEVGTRFQSGSGFSGQCIESGVLMFSDDTDSDPRVDPEVCAAMGIRSILAVPIRSGSAVSGLIEAFSDRPQGLKANSRILLQGLAEILARAPTTGVSDLPDSGLPLATEPQGTSFQGASVGGRIHAPDPAMILDEDAPGEFLSSRRHRILILGVAVAVLTVAILLIPWLRTKAGDSPLSDHVLKPTSSSWASLRGSATATPASELERVRQLATTGDEYAQFALGARYATGEDVAQDYNAAARWFTLAADQGHVVAQATLGAYYWSGRGVPEDLRKAYFWSVLAQAGGDQASKFRLASLASRMSRREVILAQEDANEWIAHHRLAALRDPSRP